MVFQAGAIREFLTVIQWQGKLISTNQSVISLNLFTSIINILNHVGKSN